ncbi:hypothetical protein HY631_02545 [Candidatus Uhrbacteria bacterium]|nr:hypothetical protein [Candidatus Uhrbacteria bacterium]
MCPNYKTARDGGFVFVPWDSVNMGITGIRYINVMIFERSLEDFIKSFFVWSSGGSQEERMKDFLDVGSLSSMVNVDEFLHMTKMTFQ